MPIPDARIDVVHQPDFGRRSLAFDLVEAFRHPLADRLVLALFNKRVLTAADFVPGPGGKGRYLSAEAMKRYLESYEGWMLAEPGRRSFRALLKAEVEELCRWLRGGVEAWTPLDWRAASAGETEEACDTSSVTI